MKSYITVLGCILMPLLSQSQVGIGTLSPNTKSILDLTSTNGGVLIPRMSGVQKSELGLTAEEAGMLVYQTDMPQSPLQPTPKGLYYFDGDAWVVPVLNGTINGQTLRWDGNKWVAMSNLFNQGSSIGIGINNPNTQLQIHSGGSPTTRLQLTSGNSNGQLGDGLLLGVTQSNNHAHLIQNENRPLWFGTYAQERMRIDSVGNVGIGKTNPSAKLDVNGSVRLGASGSVLQDIIKMSIEVVVPPLDINGEDIVHIPCPHALENAVVYVSPGNPMTGIMIGYARVSAIDTIEVKFMNMNDNASVAMPVMLHIAVIQ